MSAPALRFESVTKRFRGAAALEGVSLEVPDGALYGLIGESGSGKTTLARIAAGLERADEGTVRVAGEALSGAALHRKVQLVFQNPRGSLNPRHTVARALEAPLRHILGLGAPARRARIEALLDSVRLGPRFAARYPHELSGGEAQRVALARALAPEPGVVLLDEPTSGLDVLVQHEILGLLERLHEERGLAVLFISHDLAVVAEACERVAVLERGRIVERGATREVFRRPGHAYTRALLDAVPRLPGG